jgi:hypothetical protein
VAAVTILAGTLLCVFAMPHARLGRADGVVRP